MYRNKKLGKLYRNDLENYLATKLPKALLLYGESDFFIRHYMKKVSALIKEQNPSIEIYAINSIDYEPDKILSLLEQDSLFGEPSLVILELESAILQKMRKKFKEEDIKLFLKALERHSANRLIIGLYGAKSDEASKYKRLSDTLLKAFHQSPMKEELTYARFFMPSVSESLGFLQISAQDLQIEINTHLLGALLEIDNNDLSIAHSDLQKFAILKRPINIEDVKELSSCAGDMDLQKLFEALFSRQNVLSVYQYLLKEGIKDLDILRGLERYFYQLFLFFAHIKTTGAVNATEVLGYAPPKTIIENYTKRALRLKELGYKQIFELFRLWHIQSMQGKKELGLLYLIKIQGYLR
ncbi:DNA polymerase III subunit delta [Helicobacter cetorum]|uniref:DNA polymerase III subunit delta n=1 Tax=Helicobacter cetorum (strain ATCC BAA-429 / MIT 00-7128) TaxID=182217 RepID=I0ELA5_HELC0|nr:DNA polymerase III subunit delta [Helicobacter cetorum]AFI03724.1 DNA polymerase III subunit delta [Helicobacter cetorum MIT 00-7128]